jgi:16S rRNA (guanine(1405)-N(7))-methyltransferase
MKNHASTRERMPILEEFYRTIFSNLPPIDSVLDLACGLNPLSIPWMPLEKNFSYEAYDVFQDLMDLINAFFHRFQIHGMATQMNLLENYPRKQAALTLLLKTIPCLEQVDKNAGKKILSQIESKFAVISFPAHAAKRKKTRECQKITNHIFLKSATRMWEIQKIFFHLNWFF